MREIKFRAWDKRDKMMFYDVQTGINFDDGSHYDFRNFLGNEWQKQSDYHEWELMQYTGLKDKNSKEIYEGDICLIGEPGHAVPMEVEFQNGCFGVEWGKNKAKHLHHFAELKYYTIINACEVIGNVWENPELLK
jgi:uncharacterized phage protein (TIGR01671 family)